MPIDCPPSHSDKCHISYDEEKTIDRIPSKDGYDIGFKEDNVVTAALVSQYDDEYPDGGLRAWLVVIGVGDMPFISVFLYLNNCCQTMCITFSTFGYVNAWGVFQSFYQQTILTHSTPSDMWAATLWFLGILWRWQLFVSAWIGSIQVRLSYHRLQKLLTLFKVFLCLYSRRDNWSDVWFGILQTTVFLCELLARRSYAFSRTMLALLAISRLPGTCNRCKNVS